MLDVCVCGGRGEGDKGRGGPGQIGISNTGLERLRKTRVSKQGAEPGAGNPHQSFYRG